MKTKFLVIVGAGATLADALQRSEKNQPPLDKGFFRNVFKTHYSELATVRDYLQLIYDFDPLTPEHDSLERVMAIIYADIHNIELEPNAIGAFRALIKLFNRRIADTTNSMSPTNRFKLYRIICRALDRGLSPDEICILTFNQDLQIEKVLLRIQQTSRGKKHPHILNFPFCFAINNVKQKVSNPKTRVATFPIGSPDDPTLRVLKLHGSLNWFSVHISPLIPKGVILNSSREYRITPREKIAPDLTFTRKRKMYSFPLIIPPVTHKAGILHVDIKPLWQQAQTALDSSEEVLVFGYSCPENDFESANLIRRTIRANTKIQRFAVIDPNPLIFQRYVELTGLNRLYYFKNADSYLSTK
jgi:hypothetical protein